MNDIMLNDSNALVNRTPELIAAEINSIKDQTRNIVLFNSIEIGRRLVEAKELIPHGEWGKWLENKVDYSQRTAQNLMKIFEEYGSSQITLLGNNAKTQALANLSYTQAVAILGIPEEERENFLEEHDIENMSTRELQKAIKEKEQLLKEKEELEQKFKNSEEAAKKAFEETETLREDKLKAESEKRLADQVLKSTQSDLKNLQDALQKEKDASKKEIERLQQLIEEIKGQVSAAEDSEDNEALEKLQEKLEKAENELNDYKAKAKELEEQLKAKPIEAAVTISDKVPENIEKELSELRNKAYTEKFRVRFDNLVEGFNNLLGALDEIGEADTVLYGKFNNAVKILIDKMVERL